VAILDLHWTDGVYTGGSSGCSSAQATCQKPMPDAAQAIPFWTSVAKTFKGDDGVVFDLFNEPYASRATGNSTTGWQCWKNGGTCHGIGYQVAGMQQMVNAVRSTGANNVLMLGGEEYSNDLTGWLQYKPTDPDNNLVASWHVYNFNACASQSCWNSQIVPVIAKVPLVPGEIGENDCAGRFIGPLMAWLDSHSTGYLAWTWNNWSGGCSSGPVLITNYNGTPTNYGAAYKAHLASLH
jgi:endoglucanase